MRRNLAVICIFSTSLFICLPLTSAQELAIRRASGPGHAMRGVQNLPYSTNDNEGNNWFVQSGGWLQSRGNAPIYQQGAMIMINGQQPTVPNNQARWDEKSGELLIENLRAGQVTLTRRLFFNKDDAYVRYIDVLHNNQPQEQKVAVTIQTSSNYGVNNAQTIADSKKPDLQIGWVGQTGAGRCVVETFGGRGGKILPTVNWQQDSNQVQAQLQLSIPAGKDLAIMHIHSTAANVDAGSQFVTNFKSSKVMAGVPTEVRRIVVNFPASQSFIGEREVLRGNMLDVIELRGGDSLNGTLQAKSFKLTTFYGPVELPAERVIGMINVGQYRPRQLLVTRDGEIFGGQLDVQAIDLQLSSGQVTQVPLSQVARVGYRKRVGEPEEWALDKPMVALRSGDRMIITMPSAPIDVLTRYGLLKLTPQSIAQIAFAAENSGVHEITLTDGSKFNGLVSAEQFEFTLPASGQKINVPSSTLARLQLNTSGADIDDQAATLNLANEDTLIGTLAGQLKLNTAFDTITVNAPEIRSLTRAKESGMDVQITLWDQTRLSGQLDEPAVTAALASGVTVKIPVPLIESYSQPQPQISSATEGKVKTIVEQLSADDWKLRDQAQNQLIAMGSAISGTLRQLRAAQGPEAQQRIDAILKQFEKMPAGASAAPGSNE
jgi:hypothetical protein